jgi:hypothetical protein
LCIKEEANMVISFGKLSRLAIAAGLAAGVIASSATAWAESGPFAGFLGSWTGAGAISLKSGAVERLRCNADYRPGASATAVAQNLNCASDSYKVQLQNQIEASGSDISGRWFEVNFGAQGTMTGRLSAGRVEGAVTGPGFTATFLIRERGNRQQVVIKVQGGDITEISVDLARSH